MTPMGMFKSGAQKREPLRESRAMRPYRVGSEDGAFAKLIQEMRLRAGLTFRELAEKMEVSENAVHQYFYRKRGDRGSSTMRWFLRYAEACECEVVVQFPKEPDRKLVMTHGPRHPQRLSEVFTHESNPE